MSVSVCEDPDDNKFIECAIASNSKLIVTGDKHLLNITGYQGISVLRPRSFIDNQRTFSTKSLSPKMRSSPLTRMPAFRSPLRTVQPPILLNNCSGQSSFFGKQSIEPVSKCSILFEIKKGENFNHRNMLNISRIKI
ncbi:MAG: PIN domain-containing protein [Calditrichaeota bacterium]|nr:PIN domain-containing protein [Calditrichota bacterium]